MYALPPGWTVKDVRSKTIPLIIIQQSDAELCFATSEEVSVIPGVVVPEPPEPPVEPAPDPEAPVEPEPVPGPVAGVPPVPLPCDAGPEAAKSCGFIVQPEKSIAETSSARIAVDTYFCIGWFWELRI